MSPRARGRRAAPRPPRRTPGEAAAPRRSWSWLNLLHLALVAAGLAAVAVAAYDLGPDWLSGAGATAVGATFTWILAARIGGRAEFYGVIALLIGGFVVLWHNPVLSTGAAVMTTAVGAVLGVVSTVPAVRFVTAAREVLVAFVVGTVGAVAAIGFEPELTVARFEYATLAVSLGLVLAVVYRLGAGLHGLGTRGLVVVLVGGLAVAVALIYGELLRRYGTSGLTESVFDAARWMRTHLGASPRPLQTLVGIPALTWGCHQRARRRQGWWACAFGVAATAPIAHLLVNPTLSLARIGLIELYTLIIGLALGYLIIRLDLTLTGSRGRGARRAEEATAVRPEPRRTSPLL